MRRLAISFLAGCAVTASVLFALQQLAATHNEDVQAVEILDDVINEWSSDRISFDTVTVYAQFSDGIRSQFRVGFIPDTVRALARRVESLYHVPSAVTVSQWVLESRFGLADLGVNNTFGHTYAALRPFVDSLRWVTRRETLAINGSIVAGQDVRFAQYRTLEQCFDAHGRYLSGSARYRNAFTANSPEHFARAIAKAGYATDPDYALKLITIMRRYHL